MYARTGEPQCPHWLSVFKEALTLRGVKVGLPRLPAEALPEAEREVLRTARRAA